MIKAVIFDLFGTLVPQFPAVEFEQSLRDMAEAIGLEYEDMHKGWTEETYPARHMGEYPSFKEELLAICSPRAIMPSKQELEAAINIRYEFTKSLLSPRPDALETLRRIKSTVMHLGLISDCSIEVPDLWKQTAFDGLFDTAVFSCNAKTKKPDPHIYMIACDALGVSPEACIYVGDGCSHELEGARSVGMHPFLLRVSSEPCPESPDWEGHNWDGPRISSLNEILSILEKESNRVAGD
ncbi:HAD family hydrolase [Verrucomicrobiota bacterium]